MAKPKLLADADLNPQIAAGLRRREPNVDFLDAFEGGTFGLSDPDVLLLGAALDRVVVSCDRNTMIRHFWNSRRSGRALA